MQITYNDALRFGRPMAFAVRRGRDYMMRSEKRTPNGGGSSNRNGRKPPRRRRKAGFFYIFLTVILSLIFWPIGMIMLWRRKVRWNGGVKLVFSLISLFLCIFLIVFALTVPTGNDKITHIQDTVNDHLDKATTAIAAGYEIAYEKCSEAVAEISDFSEAFYAWSAGYVADGLECAVDMAGEGKDFVVAKYYELTGKEAPADDTDTESTAKPESTDAVKPESTDAAKPESSADPADKFEPAAESTPAVVTTPEVKSTPEDESAVSETADEDAGDSHFEGVVSSDEGAVTSDEAAVSTEDDADNDISVKLPEATPDPATAQHLETGTLTTDGLLPGTTPEAAAAAETPVAEVTPTAEPTATPMAENPITVKDPAEATVYYYASGISYHIASSCTGMKNAPAHTLAEALEAGKKACSKCSVPAASILEAENVVWTDASGFIHTGDDCEAFDGQYTLMTLSDAYAEGYELCGACPADAYAANSGVVRPTATPGPVVVVPTVSLKPVGQVLVYHSTNGSYYHKASVCKGMSGSDPYTLEDCVEDGFKRCNRCSAPQPELIGQPCLWVDENGACHTSDECGLFSGSYTFILRDEALAQGMTGCIECGADEHLQPNTIVEY